MKGYALRGDIMNKQTRTQSSNEIVRNNIKYYRITKGLTQERISELIGINEKSYCNLETGRYSISLDRLDDISKVLEVEPYILLKERHTEDEVPSRLDFYINKTKDE